MDVNGEESTRSTPCHVHVGVESVTLSIGGGVMSITIVPGQARRIAATISFRLLLYSARGTCCLAPSQQLSFAPKKIVQRLGGIGPCSAMTESGRRSSKRLEEGQGMSQYCIDAFRALDHLHHLQTPKPRALPLFTRGTPKNRSQSL